MWLLEVRGKASALERVSSGCLTDQRFEDTDGVYKMLDCGLLGKTMSRVSLHPMLKVYVKEQYIRADSNASEHQRIRVCSGVLLFDTNLQHCMQAESGHGLPKQTAIKHFVNHINVFKALT